MLTGSRGCAGIGEFGRAVAERRWQGARMMSAVSSVHPVVGGVGPA